MGHCIVWEEPALGNIFVRKLYFPKQGDVMGCHTHNFDHTTIIFKGSVEMEYENEDGEVITRIVSAPKSGKGEPTERGEGYVLVPATMEHGMTALEDDTEVWCVFAHRDEHGDPVPDFNGRTDAYR